MLSKQGSVDRASFGSVVGTGVEKRGVCGPVHVRMFHGDDMQLLILWFDSRFAEEATKRSFGEIAQECKEKDSTKSVSDKLVCILLKLTIQEQFLLLFVAIDRSIEPSTAVKS